jgi:hypothetical protein
MACSYEVTCVTRSSQRGPDVTHLGGQNPLGRSWRVSLKEAIDGIITGKWSFFVTVGGVKRNLVVAVSSMGSKYLKTDIDPNRPEILLSLPECTGPDGDVK